MHGVRGASGGVLARGPGFPPDRELLHWRRRWGWSWWWWSSSCPLLLPACGSLWRGGAECTASGVPREAFWPGDLAFPPDLSPPRPPTSCAPPGHLSNSLGRSTGPPRAVELMGGCPKGLEGRGDPLAAPREPGGGSSTAFAAHTPHCREAEFFRANLALRGRRKRGGAGPDGSGRLEGPITLCASPRPPANTPPTTPTLSISHASVFPWRSSRAGGPGGAVGRDQAALGPHRDRPGASPRPHSHCADTR